MTNAAYGYDHAGYDWTTYPERLEQAGVSWQIYQEWDNFTDNAVEYFRPFKGIGTKILAAVDGELPYDRGVLRQVVRRSPKPNARGCCSQLAARAADADAGRAGRCSTRRCTAVEPESLVPRLRADIAAGTLPAVSWLVPSAIDSEHPGSSTPVGSANLIYEVLDALASDLDTWSRTVLLINFDENDGYFDHVPPPVRAAPGVR